MTSSESLSLREKQDYETYIGQQSMGLVEDIKEIFKLEGLSIPLEKRFVIGVTPSVDSRIGPHLDLDIFAQQRDTYLKLGHATALSDLLKCQQEERAKYVKTLLAAGGSIRYLCDDEEYLVVLKKIITITDSRSLSRLFEV